jgi:hypothetical protein
MIDAISPAEARSYHSRVPTYLARLRDLVARQRADQAP